VIANYRFRKLLQTNTAGFDPLTTWYTFRARDGNDLFMRAWRVALKVIPRIGDERKRIPEEKALGSIPLWNLAIEIAATRTMSAFADLYSGFNLRRQVLFL
jgi:hypothetical protein